MSTASMVRPRVFRLARQQIWSLVVALVISLAGVLPAGAAQSATERTTIIVSLTETLGSGVTGTAVLSRIGSQTQISVTVTRTNFAGPFPLAAHLHQGRTCEQAKMDTTESLNPVDEVGRSETLVEHTLDQLLGGGWLINVHQDEAHIQTDLACGYIPPTFSGNDAGLSSMKDQVSVLPVDGEEQILPLNMVRPVTYGDAVGVDASGEAWIQFGDWLLVRIFRESNVAPCLEGLQNDGLVLCPEVAAGATDERALNLRDGGVAVYTERRIAVRSGNALIQSLGTHFLVFRDAGRDLTWIVAMQDAVTVSAAGITVQISAGEQTQVEGNDPPRDAQPATRPDLESRYPGVFPLLEDLTNGALRDAEVLGLVVLPVVPTPLPLLPPTNVSADGGGTIVLNWSRDPSGAEPASYRIYRNDVLIATVDGSETEYVDNDISESSNYRYYITSVGPDGAESAPSETVDVQTGVF